MKNKKLSNLFNIYAGVAIISTASAALGIAALVDGSAAEGMTRAVTAFATSANVALASYCWSKLYGSTRTSTDTHKPDQERPGGPR